MRKELRPILELVGAVVVTIIIVPPGLVWSFFKPIFDSRKKPLKFVIKQFFRYWLTLLFEFWNSIKYWFHHTAVWLDYIWNVTAGEMLEDVFTWKENTWFGSGKTTVSAAIGQLEDKKYLNPLGKWFSRFLDKAFQEKNHSLNAYHSELEDKE